MRKLVLTLLCIAPLSSQALAYDPPPNPERDNAARSYVAARLQGESEVVKQAYQAMLTNAFVWGWEARNGE